MNADFVQNRHAHCGCQSCTGKTAVRTANAKTASPAFVMTALATAVRVNRKTK